MTGARVSHLWLTYARLQQILGRRFDGDSGPGWVAIVPVPKQQRGGRMTGLEGKVAIVTGGGYTAL
jgi:hypothetical protein